MRNCLLALAILLATGAVWAAPVTLPPQLITLPGNASRPIFVDVDGDGRADLLVMDSVARKVFYFHQTARGFSNAPDQAIALPPDTAWVAPCEVDARAGLELLFSTATGLSFSRQQGSLFEDERHPLVTASQIFTNVDYPVLTLLGTNKLPAKEPIPIIQAEQMIQYRRNDAYEWIPETAQVLTNADAVWRVRRDNWALGKNGGRSVRVRQTYQAAGSPKRNDAPENDAIRKIIEDMKKDTSRGHSATNRMDVNGDGREDLVLWRVSGKVDVRTDIYVFLRGADQKLPEHPTQVLHCSGFPIPTGSTDEPSPFVDLKHDGNCELVLLNMDANLTTPSGMLDMWLSHGLQWLLTIRTLKEGGFSRNPDVSLPVTAILPSELLSEWPIFIHGDFNGDGRPDLVVRRTETQWFVYFSTTDGRWFAPQPALAFQAPDPGLAEITDVNGDGLADIVWHVLNEPELDIFVSPARTTKGKNP